MNVSTCLNYYHKHHVQEYVIDKARVGYCITHLKKHLGRKSVECLTPADGRQYEKKRSKKAGPGTIRRELGCLAAALNFCHADGKLSLVPALYLPAKPPSKKDWLTQDQADLLIASAGERAALFIEIGLATGGRPEAIDVLKWSQVDLVNNLIDFNEPGRSQTAKRRPVVPISEYLRERLVAAHERATTCYVLGSAASTRKCFETARNKAGLNWATRKTLRHTYCTWAVQRGVSLWKVAKVVGDTVDTVEKNYAHHHPDYLRDAVNY